MGTRLLVPLICLAVGSGGSVVAMRYAPLLVSPQTAGAEVIRPVPQAQVPSDEVLVEIRVRVPEGKNAGAIFSKDTSGLAQGALVSTNNPLDLAIEGEGFFQVILHNGDCAYTRIGNVGVGADGSLITAQGFRLSPEIKIPMDAMYTMVSTDGTVSVQMPNVLNTSTVLGQLTLARFPNPGWMTPREHGLWQENARSGCPLLATPGQHGMGIVRQGFRERQSDRNAAALIELIRDLGNEAHTNNVGNNVRVSVKTGGKE